ncbi:MAG: hypothetical protein ACYTFI_14480 [Planctomycetota bacterium]
MNRSSGSKAPRAAHSATAYRSNHITSGEVPPATLTRKRVGSAT